MTTKKKAPAKKRTHSDVHGPKASHSAGPSRSITITDHSKKGAKHPHATITPARPPVQHPGKTGLPGPKPDKPAGPAVGNLKYDYYKTPGDFLKQLTPDQQKYLGEDVDFANEQSQYTTNLRDYNNNAYLGQSRTNDDMLKALSNLGYKGAYATSGPKDATGDYSAFHTGIKTDKAKWDPTDENTQYGSSVHDIRNTAAAGGGIGDGYYLQAQANNQRRYGDQATSIIQATQRANTDSGNERTAQNNSVNGLVADSRIAALRRINAKYGAQVTTPGV